VDGNGRGTPRGAHRQQRALSSYMSSDRTPGVGELGGPRRGQRLRIAAGLTRSACVAVPGVLKVAKEVVVLE